MNNQCGKEDYFSKKKYWGEDMNKVCKGCPLRYEISHGNVICFKDGQPIAVNNEKTGHGYMDVNGCEIYRTEIMFHQMWER